MKALYKYTRHCALLSIFLFAGACNTEDATKPEPNVVPEKPKTEAIGTYMYDGRKYDILYGIYAASSTYYEFLFSPNDKVNDEPIDIYLTFTIRKGWCTGEKLRFDNLHHNDDYAVVYEDPDHYYSQYKKVSGEFSVLPAQEKGRFVICMNVVLADGKALVIDFDGVLKDNMVSE